MPALDLPTDEWRSYRLLSTFGMPPTVQDEQPAVTLDWMLAIHDVVESERANREAR